MSSLKTSPTVFFEHSNRRVDEQNRQSLNSLLSPLREQLDGFRRQVQDSFGKEAQERHTLTHEIRNLQQLNAQMAQEAINLTRALKGDNKTQGNWGRGSIDAGAGGFRSA